MRCYCTLLLCLVVVLIQILHYSPGHTVNQLYLTAIKFSGFNTFGVIIEASSCIFDFCPGAKSAKCTPNVYNSYVPSCQQHLIIMRYSCRHCQRIDFVEFIQAYHGQSRVERTSTLDWPWPVSSCKFYKVDSLAVATRISHNYQVLLDDGNRIIIPQGNFKFKTIWLL